MNQAASHLADERSSKKLYTMKEFYRQKGAMTRKLYLAKSGLIVQDYCPLGDLGSYQVVYPEC